MSTPPALLTRPARSHQPIRPAVTVRRAIPDDEGPLLFALAESFLQVPLVAWLVPDENDRRPVCYRYFRLVLQHALKHGTVDTNADLSAVAVWYGRGEVPPAVEPDYQDALEQAAGRALYHHRAGQAFYICGSPRLIEVARELLPVAGVAPDSLHLAATFERALDSAPWVSRQRSARAVESTFGLDTVAEGPGPDRTPRDAP
ncbi:hypothetical protein ABZ780_29040 [Micromonospora sp. NPDC047467]|uniref:hypothetical protein n=1 Tax=Micromonospora sp. NPDC047467 TaxID=3154814 RepID=UPI00340F651A